YLHRRLDSVKPDRPSEVSRGAIVFDDEIEPARYEVFLGDTLVERVQLARAPLKAELIAPRIRAPARGTVLALDPDIPGALQRVLLSVDKDLGGRDLGLAWRVGGKLIGEGSSQMWGPIPGKHRIELLGSDGRVLDSVDIEVRGARLRQRPLRSPTN